MKTVTIVLLLFLCIPSLAEAQVDYQTEIQPIFNASCTSCHGSNGGVNLRSYSQLINSIGNNYGTNLVVPGDPDASGLVDKIEANPQFGSRMPSGGQLSDSEIALIRTWIQEGANEVATSTETIISNPSEFKLIGNYPNPFNPSTNIVFDMPESARFSIQVFSAHGALLYEQQGSQAAGRANVTIAMNGQPSGLYFYRVSAQVQGQNIVLGIGRMTLIK
jgi:mono/diheme cytochrome c family protein